MWARWCLGGTGELAEVVRRGDSVGKWDMNNLCSIRDWSEGVDVVEEVGDGIGARGEMRERSGKIFCEWIEGEGLVGAET